MLLLSRASCGMAAVAHEHSSSRIDTTRDFILLIEQSLLLSFCESVLQESKSLHFLSKEIASRRIFGSYSECQRRLNLPANTIFEIESNEADAGNDLIRSLPSSFSSTNTPCTVLYLWKTVEEETERLLIDQKNETS